LPKSLLKTITFFCFIILFTACKEKSVKEKVLDTESDSVIVLDAQTQSRIAPREDALKSLVDIADTTFVRLADYSSDFEYDLRYATENNFLKEKVYNCAECYTRVKTAKALIKANNDFIKQGYKIKFYDCYRPNSVQYKMWEIVPNPQYVANPVKGSIHNKGGAVDITLETLSGDELDMGTDFDFFGKKAYHDNTDLPKEILKNRKVLKETMEKYGFWSVRTEWWHYNLSSASNDRIADFKWECN
jgi:D-alanyl-D-alanine dipeptidase